MKKALAVLLILLMALGLWACVSTDAEETVPAKSLADRAVAEVKEELNVYIYIKYNALVQPEITTQVEDLGDGKYRVTGIASYRDEHGITYSGAYDAVATYLSDAGAFTVDYELDVLQRKQPTDFAPVP